MTKFTTNKLQKPAQYLVEVHVYQEYMKEPPNNDALTWDEVDGQSVQLVP